MESEAHPWRVANSYVATSIPDVLLPGPDLADIGVTAWRLTRILPRPSGLVQRHMRMA